MWGALIGAGVTALGGLLGGNAAKKAAERQERLLEQQRQENRNWYESRMAQDYTQTAEAMNAIRKAREIAAEQVARSEAARAVSGGTDASVAAAKAQANKMVADTLSGVAAQGTARRSAAESQYMQTKQSLDGQMGTLYGNRAAAAAQAGGALMGAGMGLVKDSLGNMFLDNSKKGGA